MWVSPTVFLACAVECIHAGGVTSGLVPEALERDVCDSGMVDDLGMLREHIDVGFFTDFKRLSWAFYEWNVTSYPFLWLSSTAFANVDFLGKVCPGAALTSLLLRAEERLPMLDDGRALLDYATILQTVAMGRPESLVGWPLVQGLNRLAWLRAQLPLSQEQQSHSIDIVMAYCNESLDGLVRESVAHGIPLSHANLLLYMPEACLDEGKGKKVMKPAARHFRSVEIVPMAVAPDTWEPPRYLTHLATRYHRLAEFTLFLHADVYEHVQPRTMRNLLNSLAFGTFTRSGLGASGSQWFGYLSLGHNYLRNASRARRSSAHCAEAGIDFGEMRRHLFEPSDVATAPGSRCGEEENFGVYCCSTFLVHRDRVHQRPQDWYDRAAERSDWGECAASYMELLWHAVFNDGCMHEEKRQARPDLPLFLRVDNFVQEDMGTI